MSASSDIRNSAFLIRPVPPRGNASFVWVQHFIHHLAPLGMAGLVLANGSKSSNQSGEDDIRRFMMSRKPVSFCRRNQTTILEVAA